MTRRCGSRGRTTSCKCSQSLEINVSSNFIVFQQVDRRELHHIFPVLLAEPRNLHNFFSSRLLTSRSSRASPCAIAVPVHLQRSQTRSILNKFHYKFHRRTERIVSKFNIFTRNFTKANDRRRQLQCRVCFREDKSDHRHSIAEVDIFSSFNRGWPAGRPRWNIKMRNELESL